MPRIHILSDIVASKIAAGEVIERPASVVKELVENAIDAGSDFVTVDVESGGRSLIRVSDNGIGMNRDDALLSLERYATSKIKDIGDIEHIVTLGFRGEALPSIVSVSKAVIDTKTEGEVYGTRLVIDGGVLKNVTDIGRNKGTDVEVKNLFFNLPARRKFLKSVNTELQHIKRVIYDTAVSNPGVTVTLLSEGKELCTFGRSQGRLEMISQVFGETFSRLMVPLELNIEGIVIEGYIGKPETASTAFNQYIIVNGRPVRSKSILQAVLGGYGSRLPRGLYPAFALYLEVDPARVDVNIHPSKREIRIHREFAVLQAIRDAVEGLFGTMDGASSVGNDRKLHDRLIRPVTPVTVYSPPQESWYRDVRRQDIPAGGQVSGAIQTGFVFPPGETRAIPAESSFSRESGGTQYGGPVFIQLGDRYIVTAIKEGAIIIDQHVAHERILYEEILSNLRGKPAAAQQLLFPLTLDFTAADYDILEPMLQFLTAIGFGIREFGSRTVLIDAIPSGMTGFEEGRILYGFIEEMRVHGKITSGYLEKLAAAIACRSAIKAGQSLSRDDMQNLVDRMFATSSPFVCPHGRPTVVKLTLEELDRRFGR